MNKLKLRISIIILTLFWLALACNTSVLVPTAQPLPSATPTWTLLAPSNPIPTETPTPGESVVPSDTPGEPTEASFTCPGAPITRLEVGDTARVTFTNGLPLRVRSTPVVNNSNVTAQIAEGTGFKITDGPRCAPIPNTSSSFVFWEILVESTGLTGWVAEGDSSSYFIEPNP